MLARRGNTLTVGRPSLGRKGSRHRGRGGCSRGGFSQPQRRRKLVMENTRSWLWGGKSVGTGQRERPYPLKRQQLFSLCSISPMHTCWEHGKGEKLHDGPFASTDRLAVQTWVCKLGTPRTRSEEGRPL